MAAASLSVLYFSASLTMRSISFNSPLSLPTAMYASSHVDGESVHLKGHHRAREESCFCPCTFTWIRTTDGCRLMWRQPSNVKDTHLGSSPMCVPWKWPPGLRYRTTCLPLQKVQIRVNALVGQCYNVRFHQGIALSRPSISKSSTHCE